MGTIWAIIFGICGFYHWGSGDIELAYYAFIAASINSSEIELSSIREGLARLTR